MTAKGRRASALDVHRRRQRERGLQRLELQVPREDVPLLRKVAAALNDPARVAAARKVLTAHFAPERHLDFAAFLESAPDFDLLDLTRSKDTGRDIEF